MTKRIISYSRKGEDIVWWVTGHGANSLSAANKRGYATQYSWLTSLLVRHRAHRHGRVARVEKVTND